MTKITKENRRRLEQEVPLMKCGPMIEFRQRLQWLSEGMLRSHLEDGRGQGFDPKEVEAYIKWKASTTIEEKP